MYWVLPQEEKNFTKVFRMALSDGPQEVHVGNEAVIVVRKQDFIWVEKEKEGGYCFTEHLLNVPKVEGLDLTRDKSTGRDIDL